MSEHPVQARTEVLQLLRRLRARIRRYVLLEGSAATLAVLGLAFWLSLGIDYAFELPRVLRFIVLVGAGSLFLWGLVLWVFSRTFRELKVRALALILERRFPLLNDRLITTVELAEGDAKSPPLTLALLKKTADEVSQALGSLRLGAVFNVRPLVKAMLSAVCLTASIIAFGIVFDDVFQLWFRRNVLLAEEYWPRETELNLVVLAAPNERVVEFRDGSYKHPRGGDLTVLATVPRGKKIPDKVLLMYDLQSGGTSGREYMANAGEGKFRFTLAGLHDGLQVNLRGGDFKTRTPYHIEVVDPPRIDDLALLSQYPEYTGRNKRDVGTGQPIRDTVRVLGARVELPTGTDFLLSAKLNKSLQDARLVNDSLEISLTRAGAHAQRLTPQGTPEGAPIPLPPNVANLSSDGLQVQVRFLLAPKPPADGGLPTTNSPYIALPPDNNFRVTLHDSDDIHSIDPIRLAVNSKLDVPPVVESKLRGIGQAITRQATIPVIGQITDDYGVDKANFSFKVDNQEEAQERAFVNPPERLTPVEIAERFDVGSLELNLGQKLTLTVSAADADNLTGPHVVHGERYVFQIVSNDELLALIASRELNLRKRFEQILDEMKERRKDLQRAHDLWGPFKKGTAPAKKESKDKDGAEAEQENIEGTVLTLIERSIGGTRKNANESTALEQSFGDIREELENNAIPDAKPMLERLDNGIIRPLNRINTIDYGEIDDVLAVLRKAVAEGKLSEAEFKQTLEQFDATIDRMEAILAQMLKLESFNEALQLLRDIIAQQEELRKKTKEEQKKKLLKGLEGLE